MLKTKTLVLRGTAGYTMVVFKGTVTDSPTCLSISGWAYCIGHVPFLKWRRCTHSVVLVNKSDRVFVVCACESRRRQFGNWSHVGGGNYWFFGSFW